MGILVWVMMGLALWHFTIFLPDHFWGGIVGAFLAAVLGSVVLGLLLSGLSVPGQDDTNIATALQAIPGAVIGMGIAYFVGLRREGANQV
ncbi:MAG: hypothetical protein AVDCRST_MAG30-436 [uncultured Solirubrobacteraceae bacterium]|uniref:GlsB/YeaQ/YmgE family stress response membrane protein n=1 Tax=uncultured Solirubrobacteraceae bacterium TaxID=1162706 RepID=A0A6J4RK99_9ACTN|nr:MAG: hypothetical protein AVDCRST_MAG30-436 [uncultured Solirubrobacteraceae bacterium]